MTKNLLLLALFLCAHIYYVNGTGPSAAELGFRGNQDKEEGVKELQHLISQMNSPLKNEFQELFDSGDINAQSTSKTRFRNGHIEGYNMLQISLLQDELVHLRKSLVLALIKAGINVNRYDGESPLEIAVRRNSGNNVIDALLLAGADSSIKDGFDRNILFYLVDNNNTEMLDKILSTYKLGKGPININEAERGSNRTLLHLAIDPERSYSIPNVDMVKLLIKHGVRMFTINRQGLTPLALAHQKIEEIDAEQPLSPIKVRQKIVLNKIIEVLEEAIKQRDPSVAQRILSR